MKCQSLFFVIFIIVMKHYESVMVLKLSQTTTDEALMKKQFGITLIQRYMSSAHPTSAPGCKYFQQPVCTQTRRGGLHQHHGRALCFKFGDSPENCPPKFRAYSVKTLLDSKQNRRGDGMNQGMCSGGGKETKVVGSNNSIENIL